MITVELAADDALVKGGKLSSVGSFSPFTGAWNVVGKCQYKHENASLNVEADVFNGPLLTAGLVLGYGGWLAGYQTAYDAGSGKLTKSNVSAGYNMKDVVLHMNVDGGNDFTGTIYHQVNSTLEAGMTVGFNTSTNNTSLGLGTKYALDKDSSIRAKLDNNARLCTSYEQRLRNGVSLTFCSQVDLRSLNQGGHKMGLGIDLEA
jgi:voltage-dependent anion channel protein 2